MAMNISLSPPPEAPTSGLEIVKSLLLLEEEAFSWYTPESFYPVRIGQIFESRIKY